MQATDFYNKIKVMRMLKGWSQEETANKLGIAVNSYAKIERGETDVNLSRLTQIADVMEVGLSQLLDLNAHNVTYTACMLSNHNYSNAKSIYNPQGHIVLSETECANELEKSRLLLQERDKEIELLRQQIIQLQEINALLKVNAT